MKILEESGQKFEYPVYWGADLSSEHERYLVEKHFKCPVILYDYPAEIKAFYMKLNEDKNCTCNGCIIPKNWGNHWWFRRESDHDKLLKRVHDFGVNEDSIWWYLESRKFGTAPRRVWIGFRTIDVVRYGMTNIRDVILSLELLTMRSFKKRLMFKVSINIKMKDCLKTRQN